MDPLLRERIIYPPQQQYYPAQTVPQQVFATGPMTDRFASLQLQDCYSTGRPQYVQDREILLCPGASNCKRSDAYYHPTAVASYGASSLLPPGAPAAAAPTRPAADDYRERLQLLMARHQQQQQHDLLRHCSSNSGSSGNEAVSCSFFSSGETQQQHVGQTAESYAPFVQRDASWTLQQQLAHEQDKQQMMRERPHQSLRRLHAHQEYESSVLSQTAHTQSQQRLVLAQQRLLNAQRSEMQQQQQQRRYLLQHQPHCRAEESDCVYVPSQYFKVSKATEDSFSQESPAVYFAESSSGAGKPTSTEGDPVEMTTSFACGFQRSENPSRQGRCISAGADAAGGAVTAAATSNAEQQQTLEKIKAVAQGSSRPGSGAYEQQQGMQKQHQQLMQEQRQQRMEEQQQQQMREQQQQMQERQQQVLAADSGDSCGAASQFDGERRSLSHAGRTQSALLHLQRQQMQAGTVQQELLQRQWAAMANSLGVQGVYPSQTAGCAYGAVAAGASCWPSTGSQFAAVTPEDALTLLLQQRPPDPEANTLIDLDEQLRLQKQQGLSIPRLPSFVSVMSPSQRVAALRQEYSNGPNSAASARSPGVLQQQQQSSSMLHSRDKVRVIPYAEYLKTHVQAAAAAGNGKPSSLSLRSGSRHSSSKTLRQPPLKKAVIVGCNYHVTQQYHLKGSSNDAHLFAHACVEMLGFQAQNICLLCDHLPSSCYRGKQDDSATTGGGEAEQQEKIGGSSSTVQNGNVGQGKTQHQQHAANVSLWNEQRSRSAGELLLQGDVKKAAAAAADAAAAGIASFWGGITETSSRAISSGRDLGPVVHSVVDVEKLEDVQENSSISELPTRQNILKALNWLVRDAKPDDHLIFFYSGHSVQVDNMAGWEGEGYEEAIVPCDFDMQDIRDGQNCSLLTMVQLRQLLLSVPARAHLTIVLDCCGGQTILDPAGTLSPWTFIRGVKQKGLWPLVTDATDKMHRAVYRKEVWADPDMQKQLVRPRYMPGVEVQSVAALVDPLYEAPVTCQQNYIYKAFCFAGAPWGTCGVEAVFPSIAVPRLSISSGSSSRGHAFSSQAGASVIHGVFTWSFVSALIDTLKEPLPTKKTCNRLAVGEDAPPAMPWAPLRLVTYKRLLERTRRIVSDLKWNRLFKLDQQPDLTIHTGGGGHINDAFCTLAHQQQQNGFLSRRGSLAGGAGDAAACTLQQVCGEAAAAAAGREAHGVSVQGASLESQQQRQQLTGEGRGFLSADDAWQLVTEASMRDAAAKKDIANTHMPYTAADCYRRAFPPTIPSAAPNTAASAGAATVAAATAAAATAAAGITYVGVTPAWGQQRGSSASLRTAATAAAPVLGGQQLLQFSASNAPAYISMLQQQQQQGIPVADAAAQLLEQLKQQERVLQQQLQHQQQQRVLHQQRLQEQEQRLQEQIRLDEQRLQQLQQQQHLQQQQRLQHQVAQWQQQQLQQQQLQQQQCVIARLSPAAGEQFLAKDASAAVYV